MKKFTTRLLAVLCILAVMLTVIAGCGSGKTAESKETSKEAAAATPGPKQEESTAKQEEPKVKDFANKELEIAVFQGGFGKDYWDAVVQKFQEAYPGVKVNMTINPRVGEIIMPKMVAGNSPDFLSLNDTEQSGVVAALIKEKGLLELTDLFNGKALDKESALKDLIISGLLDSTKFMPYGDGKIYLAPFNSGPMGLVYNKTLFDQKGWKLPATWDEFFALGDTAKKEGRALFTYQGIYPGYLESILWPAIANAGGLDTLNKIYNYEEGSFKNDNVKKVLEIFSKISRDGYLMKGTVALNHTQSQTDMMQGKALFIPNGTWMEGEMKDAPREEGFEFALAPVPSFNAGDKQYVLASYEQFSIPAKAKNPELAKEFLKFLYTDTSVKLFGEKANGVFAVKGARELAKPYISAALYNMVAAFDTGIPMIGNWKAMPKGSKVNVGQEVFDKCVTPVMNQQMTVDQWMDNVEKAFAQIRDEMQKAQ